MYFEIKLKISGKEFTYCTPYISEAYDAISAIINNYSVVFPRVEETRSEYLKLLANMGSGKTLMYSNHIFEICVKGIPEHEN